MTSPPLAGLKVVDCSSGTAGARASGILADYGAEVIWVEPPGGYPYRRTHPEAHAVFNRGKRSAVLNLKLSDDVDVLHDLCSSADIFLESWQPSVADSLGLGFSDLHAKYPQLIYCSISGFGQQGTLRDIPGYESLVHAAIGTMEEQIGHRQPPVYVGLPLASMGAASLAVIGILSALYRRNEDGVGRYVETSLMDGILAYLYKWTDTDHTDPHAAGPDSNGRTRLVARTFICADQEYVGVHTGANGAFDRLMRLLGLTDRISPSEGRDIGVYLSDSEYEIVEHEIPRIFEKRSRDYWITELLKADVCVVPELRPGEVFDQLQVRHNNMIVTTNDPILGEIEQIGPPIRFGISPTPSQPEAAPRVGAHVGFGSVAAGNTSPSSESTVADRRPLLDGVHVLDLGVFFAGPYSSRLLADLGADVIKLEPTTGDPLRGLAPVFRAAQAGKRGMAANLKDPALKPLLVKLIRWADIVHHNMRPGAAERLGVGFEQVHKINPRAIYMHAPGWGSSGPAAQHQSFAPLLSGFVGASYEAGGQFNPPIFPLGNEDPGNGLLGAVALLIGLVSRQSSGVGEYVENPQLHAALGHVAHIVRDADGEVIGAGRLDPLQFGISALDRLYETSDGWVAVVAQTERHFVGLEKALQLGLRSDPRFSGGDDRIENFRRLGRGPVEGILPSYDHRMHGRPRCASRTKRSTRFRQCQTFLARQRQYREWSCG